MTAVAKISPKGQVVIPAEIRRALDVNAGDKILFEVTQEGKVQVKALTSYTYENIIGILPVRGDVPDVEELRTNARRQRAQKIRGKG